MTSSEKDKERHRGEKEMRRKPKPHQLINNIIHHEQENQHHIDYSMQEIQYYFQAHPIQTYDLTLFNNSIHSHHPDYRHLVAILHAFNQNINTHKQIPHPENPLDPKKIACLDIIYKELLNMNTMDAQLIIKNQYASKLYQWYLKVFDKASFLSKLLVVRKPKKINDLSKQQITDIRNSYSTNVYSDIQDYRRRILPHSPLFEKTSNIQDKNTFKKNQKIVKVPEYLDAQIYRRQMSFLQEMREKVEENSLKQQIKINQARINKISSNRWKERLFEKDKFFINQRYQASNSLINLPKNGIFNEILKKSQENCNFAMTLKTFKKESNELLRENQVQELSVNQISQMKGKCEGRGIENIEGMHLLTSKACS